MTSKRSSKRVVRKPDHDAGVGQPEPAADTFTVSTDDDGAASRPQSNDDRLRADKPPHWG